MIIDVRRSENGVVILDLRGSLTILEKPDQLHAKVRQLVEAGDTRILLNLRNLSYIDSTGLGAIVASYTTVSDYEGQLKLLGIDPRLERFLSVIDRFQDEEKAVGSF